MISAKEILEAIRRYVARYPEESETVSELEELVRVAPNATSRAEFRGHVTCSSVVLLPDACVLTVLHRTLGQWVFPGGHIDADDRSLVSAALRELKEETGVSSTDLGTRLGLGDVPIDINRHAIPANAKRNEPRHDHWDIRYLFVVKCRLKIAHDDAEVSNVKSVPVTALSEPIRHRLQTEELTTDD